MPDTTLDEAIKEAYASCPTNVITWETLQIKHTSLPDADVWIVKNRENLTLGLEPGGPGSEFGPNPGDPGPEPVNPGDPGAEPEPGAEPIVDEYVFLGCNSGFNVFRSYPAFDRYGSGAIYLTWVVDYALWDHPDPNHIQDYYTDALRQAAVDAAMAAYYYDHAVWVTLTAAHAVWVIEKAAYDAFVIAHAAWQAALEVFDEWVENTSGEILNKEFIGLAFELTRAASGDSGIQELSFSACDVDRVISDWLSSVAESGSLDPIEVIYRVYVSTDTSRPAIDPPLKLFLTDAKVDIYAVSARASFADLVNRAFPNVYYTRDRFPSLGN